MEMVQLLEQAKRELANATGLKPVEVTRAFRDDQGWHVGVEMLELARIPASTDLLADYEVVIGEDGGLVRFERRRVRVRCAAVEEDGVS